MHAMKTYATLNLRVPPELAQWLKEQAEKNSRSVNGETTHRLEQMRKKEQPQKSAA
jgi:predicted HicB family RNase H-like nuclease